MDFLFSSLNRNQEFLNDTELEEATQNESLYLMSLGECSTKKKWVDRDFQKAYKQVYNDYFSTNPNYTSDQFRRRFRMSKNLFLRIHNATITHDDYFVQKRNAAGKLGIHSLIKVTAALRILSYGISADFTDEYLKIGESTAIESLMRLVRVICKTFGATYLRTPTESDVANLLRIGEARGFPGNLGSIDCMHWKWKNCPTAWAGSYKGHFSEPTIILEAVASQDLWIWHAFFGLPGSNNDINVLERSLVFNDLAQGRAPPVEFTINNTTYNMGYYLADGIYLQWATLVKAIPLPQDQKQAYFTKMQESARKDVERTFGVLQSRFNIVREPVRFHNKRDLAYIMKACIIMHNMIVEEERHTYKLVEDGTYWQTYELDPPEPIECSENFNWNQWHENRRKIRSRETHTNLRKDLVEHLWERFGRLGGTQ